MDGGVSREDALIMQKYGLSDNASFQKIKAAAEAEAHASFASKYERQTTHTRAGSFTDYQAKDGSGSLLKIFFLFNLFRCGFKALYFNLDDI